MKNLYISALIVLSFILISCTNQKNSKVISQIDELLIEADSIYTIIESDNIKDLNVVYSKAKENDRIFGKYITETEEVIKYKADIAQNGNIDKGLKRFFKKLSIIQPEIQKSKVQLTNLREDISNNILADSLVNMYYLQESEILKNSIKRFNLTYGPIKHNRKLYDKIKGNVERIANNFKEANEKTEE